MDDELYHWAAITLRTPPAIALLTTESEAAPEAILVGGSTYRSGGTCDLWMFYDWLRIEPDTVVRVRFRPESDGSPLLDVLRLAPYVSVTEDGWVELYFSNLHRHEPALSADQDFIGNAVYIATCGEYALLFGTFSWSREALTSVSSLATYVEGLARLPR